MVTGRCLCGRFAFEADGPFVNMMNCHCTRCRKHHGSAFATFVGTPAAGFRWLSGEGEQSSYPEGSGGRTFCPTCGSKVPGGPWGDTQYLPAGLLDGDPGIRPQMHAFVRDKAPWFAIEDDVVQYQTMPPEYPDPGIPTPPRPSTAGHSTIAGSCLCGEVAFEITAPPERMGQCHCSRCRKARGAAFSTQAFVPKEQFRWLSGRDQVVSYRVPEAKFFTQTFCSKCGSPAPVVPEALPFVLIPLGSLDDDPVTRAQGHIYVASKAPWYSIPGDLPRFDEMPG